MNYNDKVMIENLRTIESFEPAKRMALSYARVSRLIQAEGDGLRRQKSLNDEGCERFGVTIATKHQMTDMGLSAYRGKNLESGALGALLKEAEAGRFPDGTILFVESLDRISRAKPEDALRLFLQIINTGLVVVTTIDWQEYRTGQMDMMKLFGSIMIMSAAHEESAKKEFRTKQSYAERYAKAAATGVLPRQSMFGWLTKDPVTGLAVLDGVRKPEIVRRIFDMCLNGCGLPKIAKTLNAAGEKPFAMDKKTKGRATYWTVANVAHILKSKAVYGDYHRKNGEVLIGIFPEVVSKEDFYRAQAAMTSRLKVGRGRKGEAYSNLFGGIAKCHYCGEPMTIRNPKKGRAIQFYCKGSLVGKCTDAAPWNYERFEKSFLSFVAEIDLQAIIHGGTGSRQGTITQQIQQLEGEGIAIFKSQQAFIGMIEQDAVLGDSLRPSMVKNATKLKAVGEQIAALEIERNKIQSEQQAASDGNRIAFPKVGTGPGDVTMAELCLLRTKAAEHIRTIVECIELDRPHLTNRARKAAQSEPNEAGKALWMDYAKRVANSRDALDSKYLVRFKGGASRLIYPDNRDATESFVVANMGLEGDRSKLPQATRTIEQFAEARMA
ncbi:recombinase family protein [Mesorhizobium sp. M1088]|uniref:recombinase family protein n=1 Tax=Mesorhizobium sp. M1088 TaxID=2957056 RepID=UPI00333D79C5